MGVLVTFSTSLLALEAQGAGLSRLSPATPLHHRGALASLCFASPGAWKGQKSPAGCGRWAGSRDSLDASQLGQPPNTPAHLFIFFFFFGWPQRNHWSAPPPPSTSSSLTLTPFPPPLGCQADTQDNQSQRCIQTPARGTGRIGPMGALGAGAPQSGRGAGTEWAVLS